MSRLIIVCGLAGSGKTTLAKKLSKKLGIVCLHKDTIKEKLYDLLELSTLEDSLWVGQKTMQLLFCIAEEQLANGQNLIIEAPFNFEEDYKMFEDWERKHKIKIHTIICSIGRGERLRRYKTRPRHRSHHDNDRLAANTLKFDETPYEKIPGEKIKVFTDKSTEELVGEIIKKIN